MPSQPEPPISEAALADAVAERDWRRAAPMAMALAQDDRSFTTSLAAAEASLRNNRPVEAEAQLMEALLRRPLHRGALSRLSQALLQQQRYGLAGLYGHDALALGAFTPDLLAGLATIASRMGKAAPERAIARARSYWEGDPPLSPAASDAPLLAREVQQLAQLFLGHDLPGDEAYEMLRGAGSAVDVAAGLAGHISFTHKNIEMLAMLAQTGRAA